MSSDIIVYQMLKQNMTTMVGSHNIYRLFVVWIWDTAIVSSSFLHDEDGMYLVWWRCLVPGWSQWKQW